MQEFVWWCPAVRVREMSLRIENPGGAAPCAVWLRAACPEPPAGRNSPVPERGQAVSPCTSQDDVIRGPGDDRGAVVAAVGGPAG